MDELSVQYDELLRSAGTPVDLAALGSAVLEALAERYRTETGACALVEFAQSGATYLFDLASSADLPQEDRTVAACAVTPDHVDRRDVGYQRGFPMAAGDVGAAVDRGHLIPHLSGGEFGPNIFRQDRSLNRGWSERGKRYRALEREATTPGTFYIAHLIYADDTAYPSEIEIGLLRGGSLHVERFDNHPT